MKKYLVSLFIIFFGVAFWAGSASATILWAGGEDNDFICTNTNCVADQTSNQYNSTYEREDYAITACSCTTDPPPTYASTPTFTAGSTLWIHANFWNQNGCDGSTGDQVMRVLSPDGVGRIILSTAASNIKWKISTRNAAGTITDLVAMAAATLPVQSLWKMDFYIKYSSTGEVTLYENGVLVADYSGNVVTDAATQLNQVQIAGPGCGVSSWSEMIIATTDTRNMHLATLKPTANGNAMAWTGIVGSINPVTYNDANNISSGTANQIAEFTVPSLPTGNFSVNAVVQSARATASATGPQNLEFDVRTGGTDYQTANQTLTLSFANGYYTVWSTNPNTSAAWTTSDLGNAGFNLGVESKT